MSAIQKAIQEVSNLVDIEKTRPTKKSPVADHGHVFDILTSIKVITDLSKTYQSRLSETEDSSMDYSHLALSIRDLSKEISSLAPVFDPPTLRFERTLFEALEKHTDENFHSDYIARLLKPELMGNFAYAFLSELLRYTGIPKTLVYPSKPIHIWRERRLDAIDESLAETEVGAKRIDIFIKHNDFVMIIENKIDAQESENQTTDYFETTKRVYATNRGRDGLTPFQVLGILLAPNLTSAKEREFKSLTYPALYKIATKAANNTTLTEFQNFFLTNYIEAVFVQFILRDKIFNDFIYNYWR